MHLDVLLPQWLAVALVVSLFAGIVLALKRRGPKQFRNVFMIVGICWISMQATFLAFVHPSHDRDWGLPHSRLPSAEIRGDLVSIKDIRRFRYASDGSIEPGYFDSEFNMDLLDQVWFGVDRFTEFQPVAHTFLSFGFRDTGPNAERSDPMATHRYVAISIETRREKNEKSYSPIGGLFRKYEIIYVIGDEEDILGVRSGVRQNVVQLYPLKAAKPQLKALFMDIMERVNGIHQRPEFYHTLRNNCTNNLVYHKNNIMAPKLNPFQRGVVFPGYSDWLAYQHGLIRTELSLTEARDYFRVDQRVNEFKGIGDFSTFIRSRTQN